MTDLTQQLEKLHDRILEADADSRYLFQPQLSVLVEQLDAHGVSVPTGIRTLEEELRAEVIEAQFDNMPV